MVEREKIISLVKELQSGKNEAFEKLYEAYFQDISYYIVRIVNDKELAADLTQETFIEIYQNVAGLKEPEAFMKWSKTIAYHKCTAHFRKKQDVLLEENEEDVSLFDTLVEEREEFIPDEALDQDELKKTIQEMIGSLPEEQRAAIMMRYFDEMSVQDIAEVQNVSEGTVKSRLNYARKAIKSSVEEYEKKTGVKLHCVGVLPLLLWAFQGYWKSIVPTSVGGATAITASIKGGATVASKSLAKNVVKKVVKKGVKTGAKNLVTKVAIGAVAVAVVTGGVVVGTRKKTQPSKTDRLEQVNDRDETAEKCVIYRTVFGDTLVLSAKPIEEYNGMSPNLEISEEEEKLKIKKAVVIDKMQPVYAPTFNGYKNLETIEGLGKIDTKNIKDMSRIFEHCESLKEIEGIEDWDVSKVTNMSYMFNECLSLVSVGDLGNWDVSNVKYMGMMFGYCTSLTTVGDLSNWDVSNVQQTVLMFGYCTSLTNVGDLSNWDVSNMMDMRMMFSGCTSLTSVGDLNNWDVSEANKRGSTRYMFKESPLLEQKPSWYKYNS